MVFHRIVKLNFLVTVVHLAAQKKCITSSSSFTKTTFQSESGAGSSSLPKILLWSLNIISCTVKLACTSKMQPWALIRKVLDLVISPSIMIPAVCVMILVIYYLQSLARGAKEQNARLKLQLHYERNEGKRVIQLKNAGKENVLKWWILRYL